MDLQLRNDSEKILDIEGRPLQADAAVLLKSMDKMLTLGSYYSTGHDQYILASNEAAQAMVQAISPRTSLTLEITSEGLMIGDQQVAHAHRHVRQIHELLVPLNIAQLEIGHQLTGEDLRKALAVLQDHKLKMVHSDSFQEVVIHNLPESVRSVSRSVVEAQAERDGRGAPGSEAMGLDALLGIPGGADEEAVPENERLAKEFMELVNQILKNLEQFLPEQGAEGEGFGQSVVSRSELQALRQGLERLVEINPTPRQLLNLIAHARSALDLSRDASRTDLVFQVLRKDLIGGAGWKAGMEAARIQDFSYAWTVDGLLREMRSMSEEGTDNLDPAQGAVENHTAMCLYLLGTDPPASLRQSLEASLAALWSRQAFRPDDLTPALEAVKAGLNSGFAETADHLIASLAEALRGGQPTLVGEFWDLIRQVASPEDLPIVWPHLVNDVLLGLGTLDAEKRRQLLSWAGSISPEGAEAQLPRLLERPALSKRRGAADLFQAPVTELYSVHRALASSPLASWLGRSLQAHLKSRPFSNLVKAVMTIFPGHQATNLSFYLELMAQPDPRLMDPELKERVAVLLMGSLGELPRAQRAEPWVAGALASLGELEVPVAEPLLEQVVRSKRWLFFMEWPEPCRVMAAKALAQEGK
jgi:hypothetical protein